jgi:hypothetical protein
MNKAYGNSIELMYVCVCVCVCVCVSVFSSYHLNQLTDITKLFVAIMILRRSQWPRGLRCMSAAARLLISWFRIQPWTWMFVCCDCCVLSGRGLCDGLITRPEESYRLWCVVVCDLEKQMRRPRPTRGLSRQERKENYAITDHLVVMPFSSLERVVAMWRMPEFEV